MSNKTIDNMVEEWHRGDDPRPLSEFLGMTTEEYNDWVVYEKVPSRFEEKEDLTRNSF